MSSVFPRPKASAIARFMNQERPYATLYLYNPTDMKREISNANEKHMGLISVNLVEKGRSDIAFTRSIPLFKKEFDVFQSEGFKGILKGKEGEAVVAISLSDEPLKTQRTNMQTKVLKEKYLEDESAMTL